ncbi:MAG TPA: HD domain-containing phosphohydrolase [Vicinamibacteria bacterium]|jgi:HD-GYP domain-containing protein (c-di-GMP phosphodiesterase class II)
MANIVIWGKARDILAGELPVGFPAQEVDTLATLQALLDPRTPTLILTDAAHLAREKPAVEAWVRGGGTRRAVLVAVCAVAEADDALRRHPYVDDILIRPVTPPRLRLRLERALELVNGRRVIEQLDDALARKSLELHELNNIGVALSAQRDINKLLELILSRSRSITAADAGTLYLVERGPDHDNQHDDQLRFVLAHNDSLAVTFSEFKVPLNEASVAGYAALSGQPVNVGDAYHLAPGTPYTISRAFDERSGYRTKSVLAVPMKDHQGTVIGVVQLINKKRDAKAVLRPVSLVEELVVPFTSVDEELVSSLASQAAVAFENTRLIEEIKTLFDSFVRASVTAIESRDPTTSGHSGRVAVLTVDMAEKMDALTTGPFKDVSFTRDQLEEIRYASLLHDFGKVGVREKVLIKGKKLYVGEQLLIKQRFAYIKRTLEAEHLRAKLEALSGGRDRPELAAEIDALYAARMGELETLIKAVMEANEPTILEEERFRALLELPSRTFDMDGQLQPYLTANELQALSIRRGSLSEKERREIESHVTHTYRFLAQIPWTQEYRRVPDIAYAHHEKLDGSGYPRGLAGPDIPIQSKMMTISDIFDALVAWDRPYKKSVPVEKALDILREETRAGKLDPRVLDLFIGARVFEKTLPVAGAPASVG